MFWRGVWGYLPANILQGAVGFLTIVVFTRLLSAEEFGRYALAFSVMTLAHVAMFTWLEAAMARFWPAQKTDGDSAAHFASLYRTALLLSAVFLAVCAVVLLAWPMDLPFKLALAAGLAGAPARCLIKLGQERYRAAGEVGRAATLDMALSVGGFGIGALLALAGAGAAAPLAGLGIAPLLALPFVLPGELRRARGGGVEAARLWAYARFGYPIAASLTLALVLSSTDRFLLALFMNEAATGAYHAGYSLANRTLDVLFLWLGAAGMPALVMALERGGQPALRAAAGEQASTFVLITLPAAVGLALVARPLAEVLVGEALRAQAAAATPWIALGSLLAGFNAYYFGQAFTLGRRTGRLLLAMTVPAGANVVLNLLLIPPFGVLGAAWATAASFAIGTLAFVVLGRAVQRLPLPWSALVRCGIACAAMAAVVLALPSWGGPGELVLKSGVGALVYAVLALTLNAGGVRDSVVARLPNRRSAGDALA